MIENSFFNNFSRTDVLPPLTVSKKVKESDDWKKAVLDSFENIGLRQLRENIIYKDYYDMVEGRLAIQELRQVIPHLGDLQDLLNSAEIPSFLKHYDIIGLVINTLVNKYADLQDKFHVTDEGEIAESEFLRFKTEQLQGTIMQMIQDEVKIKLAEKGLTTEGKQFNSDEEQQAYIQQIQEAQKQFTPEDTLRSAQDNFKTVGTQWAEATLDYDKRRFSLSDRTTLEMKDYLLTGRYFREYKVGYDKYYPKRWSPINTFFSKEIDNYFPQKGEYIGRIHHYTPSEIIREYGHKIPADIQKKLLGGDGTWKSFITDGLASGSVEQAIQNNFHERRLVPFTGYYDYKQGTDIEDLLGLPMAEQTVIHTDGSTSTHDTFLPRFQNSTGTYTAFANVLRGDLGAPRPDLCQVTEVYFIAQDLFGYLTYENEFGRIVREEVTEDILPEFLKEKGIKKSFKTSLEDLGDDYELNTLKWTYVQNTYEGLKIQSPMLEEPLYLYCKKMDYQIKGDSDFERLLPVGGYIGDSLAAKLFPFQAQYNLCMNQIHNLMEKEIGIFVLLDVALIPSEWDGNGSAKEALFDMIDTARDTGILPIATSGDSQKAQNHFNQFASYDLNYRNQIQTRIQQAEYAKQGAYEQIGINPAQMSGPTTYQTAEGVKVSQEVSWLQTVQLYNNFNNATRQVMELHLAVAQYAQSAKKDLSLFYTKSDGSYMWLSQNDPDFPLRRFGLVVSDDSRKRKELETIKQIFLQNNTTGADPLEIAKYMTSDSFTELVRDAMYERNQRMQQADLDHQRQMEQINAQNQAAQQLQETIEQREDARLDKKIQGDIAVAQIQAAGRASDKNSDAASFQFIQKSADQALKQTGLDNKADQAAADLQFHQQQHADNMQLQQEALKQKAEQIALKKQQDNSANYRATINKN